MRAWNRNGCTKADIKFTGKLNRLTLKIDRPKLTAADEQRLLEAQRNNKTSE